MEEKLAQLEHGKKTGSPAPQMMIPVPRGPPPIPGMPAPYPTAMPPVGAGWNAPPPRPPPLPPFMNLAPPPLPPPGLLKGNLSASYDKVYDKGHLAFCM